MDLDRWMSSMMAVRSDHESINNNINNNRNDDNDTQGKDGRRQNSSPPTKTTEPMVNRNSALPDRYKHDMEQALAMQRQWGRSSAASKSPAWTVNDVQWGLRGLDEADELRENEEWDLSFQLYELSLELLIRFLKSGAILSESTAWPSSSKYVPGIGADGGGIDREHLEARLQVALSDAEQVKERCRSMRGHQFKNHSNSGQHQTSSESTQECGRNRTHQLHKEEYNARSKENYQTVIRAIRSILASKPVATSTPATTAQALPANTASAAQVRLQRQSGPSNMHSGSHRNVYATTSHVTPAPAASTATNPEEDALRQTILSDLHIPLSDVQQTTWDDIAGLAAVKQSLQETAILPLVRPDLFTGLRKPQNILLWGPPGTGKTMLVRAVARESGCHLFTCTASAITSKWMGQAEKLVRTLFDVARKLSPSIIFIDEVDALLSSRKSDGEHEASRRLKTEFMVQMDGIKSDSSTSGNHHVLLLACTNCPWDIDSAVLRRFPRRILVPLPDRDARRGLLMYLLKKAGPHNLTSRQITQLADRLQGFSCADITAIASEASFGPLRSLGDADRIRGARATDLRPLSLSDFDAAIACTTKSIGANQLRRYEEWQKQQAVL